MPCNTAASHLDHDIDDDVDDFDDNDDLDIENEDDFLPLKLVFSWQNNWQVLADYLTLALFGIYNF